MDEEEFAEFEGIDELAEAVAEEDRLPAVLNPVRVRDMRKAELILQKIADDNSAKTKIQSRYNEPFKSMGSIELETKSLRVTDIESFRRASLLADNVDIYPLTDGNVRISFGFHGIAIPVMEEEL